MPVLWNHLNNIGSVWENGMQNMKQETDLREIIKHINPAALSYQEWLNVGMGLKEEGYSSEDWEQWSQMDPARYHGGECAKKWKTFQGAGTPVTAGTIVKMAMDQGWQPARDAGRELDWNDWIYDNMEAPAVTGWNGPEENDIKEPNQNWNPVKELITYLETLFDPAEYVGYVVQSWKSEKNEKIKYLPTGGSFSRTSRELIEALNKCKGDLGAALGDYKPEAGAWIRFNPLDGKGIKNDNVTNFKYALVESDTLDIQNQNAVIRKLELPVACLVHSGSKSLHAIVRIEAENPEEYRKRVDYLYAVCDKNGLQVDRNNGNPSRLSRMPGIIRNGHKQFLVATNIGKSSWAEWKKWMESIDDDLPNPESMADVWNNLPALSPPLIQDVLRQGHKMLLAGPSKAGKSYALIELCCSIAEGRPWLGFPCAKGKILYVNLELDRASCLYRFRDVYTALRWHPDNLRNIDVWNLRGKSAPMDKLAPKLIQRAANKNYIAIIIDPIYKVITGDENSADQMANFCNQFDKVCTELGCAVIYCHHHSKGSQGGKRSMDRASGSGVFARDPDALLDLIELPISDSLRKQISNNAVCNVCAEILEKTGKLGEVSQDDLCSEKAALQACKDVLTDSEYIELSKGIQAAKKAAEARTAWRIDGTLREFPKFPPINLWFDYPIHEKDNNGILADIDPEQDDSWRSKKQQNKQQAKADRKKERNLSTENAFEVCKADGKVTVKDLAEYMGVTEKTVRSYLKEHGGFWIEGNEVGQKL